MSNPRTLTFISAADYPWGAEHSLKHILKGMQLAGVSTAVICKTGPTAEFLRGAADFGLSTVPRGKSKIVDLWLFLRGIKTTVPAGSRVIVFSLDLLPIALLSRLTRHGRTLQFTADLHDNPTKGITRSAVSFFLRFYSSAIVISEYLLPLVGTARKVHVVPRPIEIVEAASGEGSNSSNAAIRVGVVGRVDPAKRIELAIDAVKAMSCGSELHVFGTPMADSLYFQEIKKVAQRELEGKAVFHGHRKPEDIYESIDILFVGNENEPSGRTVGEALSWGVPVVVPDTGGAMEFIIPGESGLVYKNGEAPSATRALDDLALNSHKRSLVGRAGRAKVIKERSPAKVAAQYLRALGVLSL